MVTVMRLVSAGPGRRLAPTAAAVAAKMGKMKPLRTVSRFTGALCLVETGEN